MTGLAQSDVFQDANIGNIPKQTLKITAAHNGSSVKSATENSLTLGGAIY